MKMRRINIRKTDLQKSFDFARIEAAFAIGLIKSNPVTPERLAAAESKASLARDARSAEFLDAYRAKANIQSIK